MRTRTAVGLGALVAVGIGVALWASGSLGRPPTAEVEESARNESAEPSPAAGLRPAALPKSGPAADTPPASPAGGEPRPVLWVHVVGGDKPVAGARVSAFASQKADAALVASAVTDSQGLAQLDGAGPDTRVEIFADGFRSGEGKRATLSDGTLEVHLEPGVAFDGRVLDAASGKGIAGASVTLGWGGRTEVGPTDAEGRFHVTGIADEEETRVTARAAGHVAAKGTVVVDGGKPHPKELVLRLAAGGAVTGRVLDAAGNPVGRALVRLRPREGTEDAEAGAGDEYEPDLDRFAYDDHILAHWRGGSEDGLATTAGPDGAYRVEGLAFDTAYEAVARAEGNAASAPLRGLGVSSTSPVRTADLTLRRPATVLVRVTIPAGLRVPASARVRVLSDDALWKPSGRDADGRFRVPGVDVGTAHAFAEIGGYSIASVKLSIVEGAVVETEVVLERAESVEGVVVDGEGQPIAGAEVEVDVASRYEHGSQRRLYTSARSARTDEKGRFTVRGVPAGPVVLVADWSDWKRRLFLSTREFVRVTSPARGVRVVLTRMGGARVRLLTPDGKPFVGEVSLSQSGTAWSSSGGSDDCTDGVCVWERLLDGTHTLSWRPRGYAWVRRTAEIKDGSSVDFGDVTLDPGVSVSGRVLDTAGKPVVEADVRCVEMDERRTRTDAEGAFSFDHFPREPITLRVRREGFVRRNVTVEVGKWSGSEIRLRRFAHVVGVVKKPPGSVDVDATVALCRPGAVPDFEMSWNEDGPMFDEEGAFLSPGDDGRFDHSLPPGRWVGWWKDSTGKDRRVGEWTFTEGADHEVEVVLPAD